MKFTRETAIEYLASNPNFTFSKASDTYTTAYLKRQASKYQKAEQAGKEITRAEARGHGRAPVHHISRDKGKGVLDQYQMTPNKDSKDGQMYGSDLKNLIARSDRDRKKAGKPKSNELLIVVTGKPNRGSGTDKEFQPGMTRTYSYWILRQDVMKWLKDEGPDADLKDFVDELAGADFGYSWDSIESVNLAWPEDE